MKNVFLKNHHHEAEIPALDTVLQCWIDAQRKYMGLHPDDNPWAYGECSCTGFLAAGVWLAGGIALEEWKAEKGSESDRWNGRGDLWISLNCEYAAYIEAKFANIPASHDPASIESSLSEATMDASKHRDASAEHQIGILFVVPSYLKGDQESMNERIARWLESVYSIRHSAIAWVFRGRQDLRPREDIDCQCPGVVLIARTQECQTRMTSPGPTIAL